MAGESGGSRRERRRSRGAEVRARGGAPRAPRRWAGGGKGGGWRALGRAAAGGKAGRREGRRRGAGEGGCLLPRGRAAGGSARPRRSRRDGRPGRPSAPASSRPPCSLPAPCGVRRENGFGRFNGGGRSSFPCPYSESRTELPARSRGLAGRGPRSLPRPEGVRGAEPAPRVWALWRGGGAGRLVPRPREGQWPRSARSRRVSAPRAPASRSAASPSLRSPDVSA